tara:strand:+ start:577 stop:774 length:198 start_codon:yes stop_codon:yes gene_type:complete
METELIVILNDGDTFAPIEGCYVAEVTSEGIDEACGSGANAIPEDAIIREVSIRRLWRLAGDLRL